MALRRGKQRLVWLGYRRIVVPVADNRESENATDLACRLAAEHHASIELVIVVEIPPLLPLDAHMIDEEDDARELLLRTEAIAESYGVSSALRILRGRDAGAAIVEHARVFGADVVVIGAPPGRRSLFGKTVEFVLKHAPCRVMVAMVPAGRETRVPALAAAAR